MGSQPPASAPSAAVRPLEVLWHGQRVQVDGPGPISIGRAASCTIQVNDVMVSARHGDLFVESGRWEYVDRGSTNGTFEQGRQVHRLPIISEVRLSLGGTDGPDLMVRPIAPTAPPLARETSSSSPIEYASTTTRFRRSNGPAVATSLTVGRAVDAQVRVDDILASRFHARLEFLLDGTARVVDLNSVNGTFVDGVAATPSLPVRPGQRVSVGNTTLVFDGRRLAPYRDQDEAVFSVEALTTVVPTKTGAKPLLLDVSFALPRGSLMAVLGPSGAGKSTLLGAITGTRPATSGTVRFNGRDLYQSFGEVRNRIGFVPQEDILHPLLTITTAMRHAARLRFPADTTQAERDARISTVLAQLNLSDHVDKQIVDLSGGQRKRVNVALELLSEPDLLILDEPTSGLDPGNERSVMEQLRSLADGGRTVVVVSHSTESLHLCDQVLMLAPGGRMAFQGPAASSLGFLGARDYPEAFQFLERRDPEELRQRFLASEWAALGRTPSLTPRIDHPYSPPPKPRDLAWSMTHYRTFVARYVDVIRGDRRGSLVLALQAPAMALLMLAVFGTDALAVDSGNDGAGNVLMALVLGAIYLGASNSAREIVKERPILRREQSFGVSLVAYLASKATVLGVVTIVQSFVLVYLGAARQGGPDDAVLLVSGRFEMFVVVALCGISAMLLGLVVSAAVSSTDKATTILPVMLFAQFLLAGLTFPIDRLGVEQLSWLSSARWGLGAAASTADFPQLSRCRVPGSPTADLCGAWWDHDVADLIGNMTMMLVLSVLFALTAYAILRKGDPARSLRDLRRP